MFERLNKNNLIRIYLIIYFVLMLLYCSANPPMPIGEWDDYSLEVATVLNDQNFGISEGYIAYYKGLFPEWAGYIDNYSLSGYFTKSGSGELTWYFPTYGIACVPLAVILKCLHLPAVYTFHCTNIVAVLLSLCFLKKFLIADGNKKILLILLLTINPIVFYFSWPSAEVLIFALLVACMVCWSNKWYKGAAIFISLAGTLNPTVLVVGMVMIADFFSTLFRKKDIKVAWKPYLAERFPDIVKYGACYIIALIPMIYNYYNMGHISIAGTLYNPTNIIKEASLRFFAYLFDLNFGVFPYFTLLIIVSACLGVMAIKRKKIGFLTLCVAFLGTMAAYSLIWHINCGTSGISRYNAWNSVIMIFAIALYYDSILSDGVVKKICRGAICTGIVLTGCIVLAYNPYRAAATNYTYMTPIAKTVLRYTPELYNPLFSTFNSRVNHIDGAYNYWDYLPIIYTDDDGYICKILADAKNKEELREMLFSMNGNNNRLKSKINSLGSGVEYINLSKKDKIVKASKYELGTPLNFSSSDNNVDGYIIKGFNSHEEWGTWTDGHTVVMRFSIAANCNEIQGIIKGTVFNDVQRIEIYVNDAKVFSNDNFTGGNIEFTFNNPGVERPIELRIELPDAISPTVFGSSDARILGLGIQDMCFLERL